MMGISCVIAVVAGRGPAKKWPDGPIWRIGPAQGAQRRASIVARPVSLKGSVRVLTTLYETLTRTRPKFWNEGAWSDPYPSFQSQQQVMTYLDSLDVLVHVCHQSSFLMLHQQGELSLLPGRSTAVL